VSRFNVELVLLEEVMGVVIAILVWRDAQEGVSGRFRHRSAGTVVKEF